MDGHGVIFAIGTIHVEHNSLGIESLEVQNMPKNTTCIYMSKNQPITRIGWKFVSHNQVT
jgi:hypothetical protein